MGLTWNLYTKFFGNVLLSPMWSFGQIGPCTTNNVIFSSVQKKNAMTSKFDRFYGHTFLVSPKSFDHFSSSASFLQDSQVWRQINSLGVVIKIIPPALCKIRLTLGQGSRRPFLPFSLHLIILLPKKLSGSCGLILPHSWKWSVSSGWDCIAMKQLQQGFSTTSVVRP